MCVCRNTQHRELKLPESRRFVVNVILMFNVSIVGPTGVSPPPLSSQNIQSLEKSPTSHKARVETQTMSLALDTKREDGERVKVKTCVRRNVQP